MSDSSLSSPYQTRCSTGFSRRGDVRRLRATGSRGTSCSSRTGRSWWLAKVWQGANHVAGAAAAIAIVAPEPQDERQSALLQYDLGQATYAMTIAAADLGVGTGHAAAADQDQARAVLGFPDGRFLAYMLSVGCPADKPLAVIERLTRRPFEEVVHRGGW
jgi:nitroreductase